jgi:hypothetical protein
MRALADARGIAMVLWLYSRLIAATDEIARASAMLEESLALARAVGDRLRVATVLIEWSDLALWPGQPERSRELIEESLSLSRQLGSDYWYNVGLDRLGTGAVRAGDYAQGATYYAEAAGHYRTIGDQNGAVHMLGVQAWALGCQGEHTQAASLAEQCLLECKASGDLLRIAWAHMILGLVRRAASEDPVARQHFLACLAGFGPTPDSGESTPLLAIPTGSYQAPGQSFPAFIITYALFGLGLVAGTAREWTRAVCLLSGGRTFLAPCEKVARERVLAEARAALGDAVYEDHWHKGASLSLKAAVEYALAM